VSKGAEVQEASFVSRMVAPLGRLLDFRGRSTRSEHWPYMGLLIGLYVIGMILAVTAVPPVMMMASVTLLAGIMVLLAFSSIVRRLHDVGWSGKWMAAYVALVAAFILFFFYWRYLVVHQPFSPGGSTPLLFRFWLILMVCNLASTGLALLIFVLTVLESAPGPNPYGPPPGK
jgi:uncharacterized membrane protein YhaH (DUF805 family)